MITNKRLHNMEGMALYCKSEWDKSYPNVDDVLELIEEVRRQKNEIKNLEICRGNY